MGPWAVVLQKAPGVVLTTQRRDLLRVTQLADGRAGVRTRDTGLFSVSGIPKASR